MLADGGEIDDIEFGLPAARPRLFMTASYSDLQGSNPHLQRSEATVDIGNQAANLHVGIFQCLHRAGQTSTLMVLDDAYGDRLDGCRPGRPLVKRGQRVSSIR